MNPLIDIHVRQARSFLQAGDAARAVELLEKAKALAREDRAAKDVILDLLADAYERTGQPELADRCRRSMRRKTGSSRSVISKSGASARRAAWSGGRAPGRRRLTIAVAAMVFLLILGGAAGLAYLGLRKPDLAQLASDNVGLVVVYGRYEGTKADGQPVSLEVPFTTGSAFAVSADGRLITNRHVLDAAEAEAQVTHSLASMNGRLSLAEKKVVACFGPGEENRFPARVLYTSANRDVAVLKVERRFASSLALSSQVHPADTPVVAAGYPGPVSDLFQDRTQMLRRLQSDLESGDSTGRYNFVWLSMNEESFKPTLTRGIVSVAERSIERARHMQFDARIMPGNSGGPLMDVAGQVCGVVTLKGTGVAEQAGFALLSADVEAELRPYLQEGIR